MSRYVWVLFSEGMLETIAIDTIRWRSAWTTLRRCVVRQGEYNGVASKDLFKDLLTRLLFDFQLVERDGKATKLRRRDPELKKLIKSDLVYLDESPDYCERQES